MQGWDFLDQSLDEEHVFTKEDIPSALPKTHPNRELTWPEDRISAFIEQEEGSLKSLVQAYTAEIEREAIREVLENVRWNRKKAAELLGVSYKTLLNRIACLHLQDT
jgi:DNA-binding NtrC family response regulator